MFWFLAAYICIFEDFWYLWLILVWRNSKRANWQGPLFLWDCCVRALRGMPWAWHAGRVMYTQVLTTGILWIAVVTLETVWSVFNYHCLIISNPEPVFYPHLCQIPLALPSMAVVLWHCVRLLARMGGCWCHRSGCSSKQLWPLQKVLWSVVEL